MKRRIIGKIYHGLKDIFRINYIATLHVNFRMLPIKQAFFFPIICYGKIHIHSLLGKFEIDAPIRKGMIKIGYRWLDLWPISYLPTQMNILGTIKFAGSAIISGGVSLNIQSREGYIEFGNAVVIGGGSIVKAMRHISIGERTRITGGCVVMDSNMHYVKNIITGEIANCVGSISIGSFCWINYGAIITKGTKIPNYAIVARNSFIGKDFSEFGDNILLAGSPAKVIKNGVQRIFNYNREEELRQYFYLNPNDKFFQDSIGIMDESLPILK